MNINVMDDDPILDISEYYHSLANVLLFYSHLCPVSFRQLQINEINLKKEDLCDAELQFKRAQLMYIILNPKPHHVSISPLFVLLQNKNYLLNFILVGSVCVFTSTVHLFKH